MSSNFERALCYALAKLKKDDLQLKDEQRAAIRHVYQEKDVFLWLPTGFGKSICYEILPFLCDYHRRSSEGDVGPSLVVVISPLIALMIDQVLSLRRRDVRSAIITSVTGGVDKGLLATDGDLTSCSLLYCTPEALVGTKWREILESAALSSRIVAIAVDEAHCVSKW